MTPQLISWVNKTTKLSDDIVASYIASISAQAAEDIAPIYGKVPANEFVPKGGTQSTGNGVCQAEFVDSSDVPDAAGYHYEDENGMPRIQVAVIDGLDTCVTASHEYGELTVDAPANRWVSFNGHTYALEVGDPVQGTFYMKKGNLVSNFAFPAWFDPKPLPNEKLDFMGILTQPFTLATQSYMIVGSDVTQISQVLSRLASTGHDVREVRPDLHLVFTKDFPEQFKAAKIRKAIAKRGKR